MPLPQNQHANLLPETCPRPYTCLANHRVFAMDPFENNTDSSIAPYEPTYEPDPPCTQTQEVPLLANSAPENCVYVAANHSPDFNTSIVSHRLRCARRCALSVCICRRTGAVVFGPSRGRDGGLLPGQLCAFMRRLCRPRRRRDCAVRRPVPSCEPRGRACRARGKCDEYHVEFLARVSDDSRGLNLVLEYFAWSAIIQPLLE